MSANVFLSIPPFYHPYLESLVHHPPVQYRMPSVLGTSRIASAISRSAERSINARRIAGALLGGIGWPEFLRWGLLQRFSKRGRPPFTLAVPPQGVDLIHSCNSILVGGRTPWVMDCEAAIIFCGHHHYGWLTHPRWKQFVERLLSSPLCRRILPFSEKVKVQLLRYFSLGVAASKIEVLYPAYPAHPGPRPGPSPGPFKILSVARNFYSKGSLPLLRAYQRLRARLGRRVELDLVTNLPPDHPSDLLATEGLTVRSEISNADLAALYRRADVMVCAQLNDGTVVYLEAMAHGLPIVSTNVFHMDEFVEDGKSGFLVPAPISLYGDGFIEHWDNLREFIDEVRRADTSHLEVALETRLMELIEDERRRRQMGEFGWSLVAKGRFSIACRNEILRRVYEEAVR